MAYKSGRMTADQIHLLRKSFAQVEAKAQVAALVFYRRLFELEPELRQMFRAPIEEQGRKLMDMLALALSMVARPGALETELRDLGVKHVEYKVQEAHYVTVGRALLDMLEEILGSEFTPATREAWTEFYAYMADTMKAGAASIAPHSSAAGAARDLSVKRTPG